MPYPYAADGNRGPPLRELAMWGRGPSASRIGAPAPLFPRLDPETTTAA